MIFYQVNDLFHEKTDSLIRKHKVRNFMVVPIGSVPNVVAINYAMTAATQHEEK
jgi:hypothetical protein